MMSVKLLNKSEVKKILLVSLTNIGDVILTFPVIDILKKDFPSAKLLPKNLSLLGQSPRFVPLGSKRLRFQCLTELIVLAVWSKNSA